ncbi:hypothetical protein AGMMS50212_15750 [Spirochaetia bacterium]|nr:hypothetical protein AGMMS50212_15750 [Spirochaetia bacterium]
MSFDFYRPTASDLGLAALSLETAARGAYLTIKINLKRITDKQYLKKNKAESKRLLKLAEKLSSKIYKKMLRTAA